MSIKDIAQRGYTFQRAARVWLWQARLFWLFAAGLAAFATVVISGREEWAKLTAFGLQFAGLAISVYGLDKTRRDFKKPSIAARAYDLWAKRPQWRPKPDIYRLGVDLRQKVRSHAPVDNLMSAPPDGSVEEQLAVLTQNIERIKNDIYPALEQLFALAYGNEDGLESEANSRETTRKHLEEKLDLAMTDGLLISLVGLSWTALGILLDTFGPQLLAS